MNLTTSPVRRQFLILAVITATLLSGGSRNSVKSYEGYVEGKFVYVFHHLISTFYLIIEAVPAVTAFILIDAKSVEIDGEELRTVFLV